MDLSERMASDLLMDVGLINEIADNANNSYTKFVLDSGRVVFSPNPELMLLQYWISEFIGMRGPGPLPCATAYEKGCSILKNAVRHKNANHVLHIDIKNFFPSINRDMLVDFFARDGWREVLTEVDKDLILRIVMFRNGLAVGAVTSPMLSNRIMAPFDSRILNLISDMDTDMVYTRYSDDLVFSSSTFISASLIESVRMILCEGGFKVNNRKTAIMGPGSSRRITGLCINNNHEVSMGQKRKKELKRELYRFARSKTPSVELSRHLCGLIMFARSVEPRYVDRMLVKYSAYSDIPIMLKIRSALEVPQD